MYHPEARIPMNEDKIIESTKKWITDFVIKNNICPFAAKPFLNNEIAFSVLQLQSGFNEILTSVLKEFSDDHFLTSKFIILPELQSFDDFLEVFYFTEEVCADLELDLKLVAFHPSNTYEGSGKNNPVDFANRAPYPAIQFLRSQHLESLSLTEKEKDDILENNASFLKKQGYQKLKVLIDEFKKEN